MNEKKFYSNGYGISVISNEFSYGGRDGLYEVAVLIGGEDSSNRFVKVDEYREKQLMELLNL